MPGEELPVMPQNATAEAPAVNQPAEIYSATPPVPTVERAKGLKALLLSIRNALSGRKSTPVVETQAPTASEIPPAPPLTAREASFPPPAPPKAA